ncbi:asparaginase [Streptococcus oralis]|uniref:asparaginase n=1 Tax=Streptococcus oralis TaxID=1303 RepID=UPI002000F2DC|nr:asparaginase [Streptococcus oralis]
MPKKILVLHTGGTISMQADATGAVVTSQDNPMNHVSNPLEGIGHMVHALDFFNLPSPHIKPKHMLALYHKIKEEADNYDGVVITHGTDTLEETAYFLDTMKIPPIPIVLTGAMRSSNELGSDGVYNYLSALRVASDDKAADKGVLVVMNDEIHAAKYVTKTHTTNVSTFQTPTHGPLGLIMKQEILYFKTAEPRVRFDLEHIQGLVPIISAYAGMTDELIDMLDLEQLDGLVIQAFGAGNVPKETAQKLENLLQKGIPVALVSRCFNGIAEPVYAYQGGGVQLQRAGVFFVKELNAQKARLKLLIALNAGLKGQALKDYMEG